MCSLRLWNFRGFEQPEFASAAGFYSVRKEPRRSSAAVIRYSFFGGGLDLCDAEARARRWRLLSRRRSRVFAELNMNLNEYMVELEKPLGIRFALLVDGKVIVHGLQKGGNAENSKRIMVGDILKKAGGSSGWNLDEIKDFGDLENIIVEKSSSCILLLERPFDPFPIPQLYAMDGTYILFNRGRIPIATWNKGSKLQDSSESSGNSGFVIFSPQLLTSQSRKYLNDQNKNGEPQVSGTSPALPFSPPVTIYTEAVSENAKWGHGSFPLENYVGALYRSERDLYYNHSLGMRYSKITEQIYVGSCIQTKEDVETLSATAGVTAVLNFQSMTEATHWGLDLKLINELCQNSNILMVNFPNKPPIEGRAWHGQNLAWAGKLRAWAGPGCHRSEFETRYSIRDGDSYDLRKKLPFCVGILQRLLKQNHRVYVTCTTGFDRSPACVIAYLHWMTDTSLDAAYSLVTGLHSCRPNRSAIVSATWDLVAMIEKGTHDGPPTHVVTFVWNGLERQEVSVLGDFTDWGNPIKASRIDGTRYEVEVRLPQGKYYYKFVINKEVKPSTASPTERRIKSVTDTILTGGSGNIYNVIVVGETASLKPAINQPKEKEVNIVKVIERPLTDSERRMVSKAAQILNALLSVFSTHLRLAPK